jgi:hypothetical protein
MHVSKNEVEIQNFQNSLNHMGRGDQYTFLYNIPLLIKHRYREKRQANITQLISISTNLGCYCRKYSKSHKGEDSVYSY